MTHHAFAAADLGASSGRVILGRLEDGRFSLEEMHRFENAGERHADGTLHWDFDRLGDEVVEGFRRALTAEPGLASVGVDTWGVDYGRLDADGVLLEQPYCYRDARTEGVPERFLDAFGAERLYAETGLQVQPYNSVFQFAAAGGDPGWERTEQVLFAPDLLNHRLTGVAAAELTFASTTSLLDVRHRAWSDAVLDHLDSTYGIPARRVLAPIVTPGTVLGDTLPGVLDHPVPVVAVGSHDTASAVAAVPAASGSVAYISSGTWSLVGLELDEPVLTEASRAANFTNELGVEGTVRYLKNVMGLWVLGECVRGWREAGLHVSWDELVDLAEGAPPLACVVDIDDPRLLPPGNMLGRLTAMARETGQALAPEPGAVARCILDSLALAYADAVAAGSRLAGRAVDVLHIVGGGSQNRLLCQLTAEATGLTVVAGPSEGTALGNLLVQAYAMGAITGGLPAMREVAIASSDTRTYRPGVLPISRAQWDAAARRRFQGKA